MSSFPANANVVQFLDTSNPAFSAYDRMVAEAMYSGGRAFEAIKDSILDPRAADCDPRYRMSRLAIARYTVWVAGIFDNYIQTAFTNEPKLVFTIDEDFDIADDEAEAKLEYYNSLNDGLEDILQPRNRDMILHGCGYLTVSFPEKGDIANYGNQKFLGALDAYLCYLSPREVTDWRCDLMGNLIWVKTYQMELTRSTDYGPCDFELHTWTYYTPTDKIVYQAKRKIGDKWDKKSFGTKVSDKPNSLGLPIFECSLADQICLFERVRVAAQGLFNFEADWAFGLKSQCYAQPFVASDKPLAEIIGRGSGNANEFSIWQLEKDGKCGYIVPENVAFDSVENAVAKGRESLFTTTNSEALNIGEKDQHAASGEAKAQDRQPAEAIASAYARALKAALGRSVDYIIKARKDDGIVKYKILGLDNFNPLTVASKIKNVTAYFALPGSETAKRVAMNDLDQTMAVNATPEEREDIDEEKLELEVSPKPVPPTQDPEANDDAGKEGIDDEPQVEASVK